MPEFKAQRHFRALRHYRLEKPGLGFLEVEAQIETDPRLRQRLLSLIDQEKQRLEAKSG